MSIGWSTSTTMGTLAPFSVSTGRRMIGGAAGGGGVWDPAAWAGPSCNRPRTNASPTAPPATTRSRRRVNAAEPGMNSGTGLVPAWIQLGAAVRPDDIGLERLQRSRVLGELDAFVGLLDAPVDHVAKRG